MDQDAAGGKGLKVSGVGVWHHASVRDILRNETYIGRQFWNKRRSLTKTTITYRPLEEWVSTVTPDCGGIGLFAVQVQLARNKVASPHNRKRDYLLVGLRRRPAAAGARWWAFAAKARPLPRNTVVNLLDPDRSCHGSVKADLVEGEVWTAVERVLAQPALIAAEVERQYGKLDELRDASVREKHPIHAALARCDREDQKWLDAYMKEAITANELKHYRLDIETRRNALHGQVAELDARLAGATQAAGPGGGADGVLCTGVRQALQTFDAAEKRLAFEALHLQATWKPGERLAIQGSIPAGRGLICGEYIVPYSKGGGTSVDAGNIQLCALTTISPKAPAGRDPISKRSNQQLPAEGRR